MWRTRFGIQKVSEDNSYMERNIHQRQYDVTHQLYLLQDQDIYIIGGSDYIQ
jgi:hypothetical protein